MPSSQKILYFMACACTTSISVALLGFGMSQTWAVSRLECAGYENPFNGSAEITWELFSGTSLTQSCPFIGKEFDFEVFFELKDNTAPLVLYALVVLFLVVCLICSAGSILIALYNSVSNPYQTYMGPIGVYVCSSISAALSVLVLILYAVMAMTTSMAETIVLNDAKDTPVKLRNRRADAQVGYFMVIPYTLLSLGGIVIVYLYDHLSYTQRQEQQRPTEDAPKEIMMY